MARTWFGYGSSTKRRDRRSTSEDGTSADGHHASFASPIERTFRCRLRHSGGPPCWKRKRRYRPPLLAVHGPAYGRLKERSSVVDWFRGNVVRASVEPPHDKRPHRTKEECGAERRGICMHLQPQQLFFRRRDSRVSGRLRGVIGSIPRLSRKGGCMSRAGLRGTARRAPHRIASHRIASRAVKRTPVARHRNFAHRAVLCPCDARSRRPSARRHLRGRRGHHSNPRERPRDHTTGFDARRD